MGNRTEVTRPESESIQRFGKFEVDLKRKELRRGGLLIRLQAQPFTLLSLLIQRPNEVVSRQEMRYALWGEDITVDFEQSLSSAVKKLREALNDSASNPLFIETVARHGYRFIAPITQVSHAAEKAVIPQVSVTVTTEARAAPSTPAEPPPHKILLPEPRAPLAVLKRAGYIGKRRSLPFFAGAIVLAAIIFWLGSRYASTEEYRISQITNSNHIFTGTHYGKSVPSLLTDGVRVYFPVYDSGQSALRSALIGDGETTTIHLPTEINKPLPTDISPDLTRLLVTDQLGLTAEHPLWVVPVDGGGAKRIPNTLAHDAIWLNDGRRILFARGKQLFSEGEDGEDLQLLANLPDRASWLRLSPDHRHLRFTLSSSEDGDRSIWQLGVDGKDLHLIMPRWQQHRDVCCGNWTGDGKRFLFTAIEDGHSDLWERDESRLNSSSWWDKPRRLTDGPMDFQSPVPDRHNAAIFVAGVQKSSRQIRFDPSTHQALADLPLPAGVQRVEFSSDGKWMAWIDEKSGSLWRSRADGSLRLQLTTPPKEVWMMKWSPDATRVAYIGRTNGTPWRIYIVSSTGGESSTPVPESRDQVDVDWSPDGQQLLFGRVPNSAQAELAPKFLYLHDLRTHQTTTVPSSEGITSPRLSPDGNYIAAIRNDGGELVLFDRTTQKWRVLLRQTISDPAWSHDGKALFFLAFQPQGRTVYRLRLQTETLERVIGIEDIRLNDVGVFWFHSLAPGDLPLICLDTSNTSIYKLDKRP